MHGNWLGFWLVLTAAIGFVDPARADDGHHDDCEEEGTAELDVEAWSLEHRLASEDTVMTVIRVRNEGPCDALNVRVAGGGGDQFSYFNLVCPSFAQFEDGRCVVPSIKAGKTEYFFLSATICAFVTGETRKAFTYAIVESDTPDPEGTPTLPSYHIDDSKIRIVGPHDDNACKD